MNQYVTGKIIKELREKKNPTQAQLGEELCVSSKTISKWENGNGYPDITLLEPISKTLGISITELLSGNAINNMNVSGNILKSKVYVCPICGNIIFTMGEINASCHGVTLCPCEAEYSDEAHKVFIERIENDYFVQIEHEMSKSHYISFIRAVSTDSIKWIKLYPESSCEARFPINGVKKIIYYCNKDGLFYVDVNPRIDGKCKSYDDSDIKRGQEELMKAIYG